MGEVVGAGLLAHVPTIMLPRQDRLDLNEGQEISLVPGLERLRAEVFEVLDYDTVVVFDSHWFTTVEFVSPPTTSGPGCSPPMSCRAGCAGSPTTGAATPSSRTRWPHSARSTAPG